MFSAETERKCWDVKTVASASPKNDRNGKQKIFNCLLFSSHCSPAGLSNDMSCTRDRPFPEQPPSCNPLHNVHSLLIYSFDSSSVSDALAMLWAVPRQFAVIFTVNGDSHTHGSSSSRESVRQETKWDQEFNKVLRFSDWHWRLNLLVLWWPFRRLQSRQLSDRVFWQIILFACSHRDCSRTPPQIDTRNQFNNRDCLRVSSATVLLMRRFIFYVLLIEERRIWVERVNKLMKAEKNTLKQNQRWKHFSSPSIVVSLLQNSLLHYSYLNYTGGRAIRDMSPAVLSFCRRRCHVAPLGERSRVVLGDLQSALSIQPEDNYQEDFRLWSRTQRF